MAIMIPDLAVNEADPSNLALFGNNEAERTVYQALKEQLPDNWTVRYNLVFCYWDNGKFRTDGQADFIVVVPDQGLMFLEVKGADGMEIVDGKHYWIKEDGTRGKETDDPFDQAQGNKLFPRQIWAHGGFSALQGECADFSSHSGGGLLRWHVRFEGAHSRDAAEVR